MKKKRTKKMLENQVKELLLERRELKLKEAKNNNALTEIKTALDLVLIELAKKYGEEVIEDGKTIGYRLIIPAPKIKEKYTVKTTKNVMTEEVTIGVIKEQ